MIFSLELCRRFQKGGIVQTLWPLFTLTGTPAAGLFAWYANGHTIQGKKDECSGTCRTNSNCYGKRASRRETRRKWVGGEGQDKTHLPKRQMQEADTACWEPFSTLRLSKQLGKQDGVCCSPFHAATVDFLSTQFLALNEIHKTLSMWKVTERYRGSLARVSVLPLNNYKYWAKSQFPLFVKWA